MFAAYSLFILGQQQAAPSVVKVFGETAGVKLTRIESSPSIGKNLAGKQVPHEWIEQYYAKDGRGRWRQVLSTATAPGLALGGGPRLTGLKKSGDRLFADAPSFAFQDVATAKVNEGTTVTLRTAGKDSTIVKSVLVPVKGNDFRISLHCTFAKPRETIEYFLDSLAFTPDGKPLSQGGKPDSTFSPGLRKGDNQVVGDHFFRDPVIVAQTGTLAALMMPDVEMLKHNRPMPTILDLDAKNGVVDATLMSYGFCDHRLTGHVWYAHDASMIKRVPKELKLAYRLIVDARAEQYGAYRQAVKYTWDWYGRSTFDKVLPQAMPFEEYAKVCYPAAFSESYPTDRSDPTNPAKQNKLGWFEHEIDGQMCGGIPAGWGFTNGWVSWQCWFNQLFSAWGLHWWGLKTKNQDWVDKSNKMLNLALAAPMDRGACPTTYQSREKTWLGSLIRPRADCYYDLTNMAWKGIWMLRWLEFADCPRREDILKQCREMADCMIRNQNKDGSFPTWLTKEHKVVPILDHSAQSALPCWFLGEMVHYQNARLMGAYAGLQKEVDAIPTGAKPDDPRIQTIRSKIKEFQASMLQSKNDWGAAVGGGAFLIKNVVNQQRYYDFETFFSCSPKKCLQMNGVIDDVAMHDSHTLSPPQNTLCMQWTAEALYALYLEAPKFALIEARIGSDKSQEHGDDRFLNPALKALDIMALYQNAWNISYRKAAYTFGGFGVQNSDGEYNDARQAQFGCTLADFGAALGRRDYFERGVAASRASLTLINHPLHDQYGIYPNPNYPLGLEPENVAHGGGDGQAGRTGFDWGEGSGLASMAWLLNRYGQAYESPGWRVGVDGVRLASGDPGIETLLLSALTNSTFKRLIEVRNAKGAVRTVEAPNGIQVESQYFGYPSDSPFNPPNTNGPIEFSVTLNGTDCDKLVNPVFVSDDGKRLPARPRGLAEQAGWSSRWAYDTPLPSDWFNHGFALEGALAGRRLQFGPFKGLIDPTFEFTDWRMTGWEVQGDFAETPTWSERYDFGIPRGEGFIGTCEDGRGGYDDRYQGTITSPPFILTKPKIRLMVAGGNGPGVYVELIDEAGKQLFVERGRNAERMDVRVWDVTGLVGKTLRLRIVDRETGGWGHINVGRVNCGD